MKKIASLLMAMLLVLGTALPAGAAQKDARIIEIFKIEGKDVTMTKGTTKSFTAKTGMKLSDGYTLSTGKESYCYIKLDEDSVGKVDQKSKIQISKTSNSKLAVSVLSGGVSVDAAAQAPGNSIEVRAGNSALAIRGTLFAAEVLHNGNFIVSMLSGSGEINGTLITSGKSMVTYDVQENRLQEINDLKLDDSLSLLVLKTIDEHKDALLQSNVITVTELETLPELIENRQEAERAAEDAVVQAAPEPPLEVKRLDEPAPAATSGGSAPPPVSVTGVNITAPQNQISIGGGLQLTANISPSNASNKGVAWSSSNTVVTVDGNGYVSSNTTATGTATITATTADGGYAATFDVTVLSPFTGSGTALDPYGITDADGLRAVRLDLAAQYLLGSDILLSGDWTKLGAFTGTFDGNGYAISGLRINDSSNHTGFFSSVGTGGTVKNLKLTGVNIQGGTYVGGVTGGNDGIIENCYVSGNISGTSHAVGGISGTLSSGHLGSTIKACKADVTVLGNGSNVGGIVGQQSSGMVENCYSTGKVTGGVSGIGGISGVSSTGTVRGCYSTCEIISTSSGNSNVGGIVGSSGGTVSNCVALNTGIQGKHFNNLPYFVGRVVGNNSGTLSDNYADASLIPINNGMPIALAIGTVEKDGYDVSQTDYSDSSWWSLSPGVFASGWGGGSSDQLWVWGTGLPELYWEQIPEPWQ